MNHFSLCRCKLHCRKGSRKESKTDSVPLFRSKIIFLWVVPGETEKQKWNRIKHPWTLIWHFCAATECGTQKKSRNDFKRHRVCCELFARERPERLFFPSISFFTADLHSFPWSRLFRLDTEFDGWPTYNSSVYRESGSNSATLISFSFLSFSLLPDFLPLRSGVLYSICYGRKA